MPVYTFSTKNRVVALLATLVILGAGAALLLLGLALLAGVAIVVTKDPFASAVMD